MAGGPDGGLSQFSPPLGGCAPDAGGVDDPGHDCGAWGDWGDCGDWDEGGEGGGGAFPGQDGGSLGGWSGLFSVVT